MLKILSLKQGLASILWFFASVLLWTPANLKYKFLSSHSKWIYVRFQSQLLHSQVAIITGIFVPFNLAFVAILFHANMKSDLLVYGGIVYSVWCLLMLVASLAVKKWCPDKGFLFQYVFPFLAFLASFQELSGVLYTSQLDIFENQRSISLFFVMMVVTMFFQWSTLITVLFWIWFAISFVAVKTANYRNDSEVSAIKWQCKLSWIDAQFGNILCRVSLRP